MADLDFRALCSELLAWAEHTSSHYYKQPDVLDRARALLAQPVAEGPTDEELMELMPQQMRDDLAAAALALAEVAGTDSRRAMGVMRIILNRHAVDHARAVLARWGHPTPQPPADGEVAELVEWLRNPFIVCGALAASDSASRWLNRAADLLERPTPQPEEGDIHYVWELHDAEGEWQAGGSANSLEDVQREGNRYLQTYSQDGPHKLIIQRHCVSTIEEVTND